MKVEFEADSELFIQKIKNINYHNDHKPGASTIDKPILKNKSDCRTATTNNDILKLQDSIRDALNADLRKLNSKTNVVHNITSAERNALKELQNNFNIIIREADKGSSIVVMDRSFYLREGLKHLSISKYLKLDIDERSAIKRLKSARSKFLTEFKHILLKPEADYIENFNHNLAHMYLNPKVHKSEEIISHINQSKSTTITAPEPKDLPFRPIISGTRCPLSRLSSLVNCLLEPFLIKVPSYIQDSWDLLRKLPESVNKGTQVITLDVKDLYTNVDNKLGFQALEYYMEKYPDLIHKRLNKEFILKSLETLQANILFEFDGTIYSQENGCAMGKHYGAAWATLAVGYLEETKLYPAIRRIYPSNVANDFINSYGRYQDDSIILDQHEMSSGTLLKLFNNLHHQLEHTIECSNAQLPSLDVLIKIEETSVITSIYNKPTDSFNYIHFASNHPAHIKRNIPYSLARRIKGIVSRKDERIKCYIKLRKRLIAKSYPKKLIFDAIKNAEHTPRQEIMNSCKNKSPVGDVTTLISTHHPILDKIGAKIVQLTKNADLPCLRNKSIIHGKKQPPNLKRLLVRSNRNCKRENCVKKCGRQKCGLCKYRNLIEGKELKLKNGLTIKAYNEITCDSNNLVYCILCPTCKEFYIGQCKKLRPRMNLNRSHSDPENRINPPLQVNKHLKKCAHGHFRVFPFFIVPTEHQISRETYEKYFQDKFKPTLH